jgi:metal-sulfur cluster biosynthetic enzyme
MLTREVVLKALTEVYDPEIPVDIVNLGLVYEVSIEDGRVAVKMTTTAPGCPVGDYIARSAERAISRLEGVREARVQVVYEPPWNEGMISDVGRKLLGIPHSH